VVAPWQVLLFKAYFESMIAVGMLSTVVEGLRRIVIWRRR
jgi:hypothetical protein